MNWKEVFPQASFSVKVTANLDESGAIDNVPKYDFRSE
jgi:hypothetical protein